MRATVGKDAAPDASSFSAWWPSAETLRSHAPNFTVLLLLGTAAAAAAAGLVWRSRARTWVARAPLLPPCQKGSVLRVRESDFGLPV
eukprot:365725-Chlamydomonas_euryale.AAC.6